MTHGPFTTLAGLLDKHQEDRLLNARASSGIGAAAATSLFACPPRLAEVVASDPELQKLPVNVLYSTDTVFRRALFALSAGCFIGLV